MDTNNLSDSDTLARTIWGEARGEGAVGMQAVACVIMNRLKVSPARWGASIKDVCLQHLQFSCWNENDPNRDKLLSVNASDPAFLIALDIADEACNDGLQDITNGATSYYSAWMEIPPYWAKGVSPCATIGHHDFLKGV